MKRARTNKVSLDIMLNNGTKYYTTLKYEYCPLFKFDLEAVMKYVLDKLPSLKDKEFEIVVY